MITLQVGSFSGCDLRTKFIFVLGPPVWVSLLSPLRNRFALTLVVFSNRFVNRGADLNQHLPLRQRLHMHLPDRVRGVFLILIRHTFLPPK